MGALDEQRKLVKENLNRAVEELKRKKQLLDELEAARLLDKTVEESHGTPRSP